LYATVTRGVNRPQSLALFLTAMRGDRPPVRVTLEPGGTPVPGTVRDGIWKASIERLELHSVLAIR